MEPSHRYKPITKLSRWALCLLGCFIGVKVLWITATVTLLFSSYEDFDSPHIWIANWVYGLGSIVYLALWVVSGIVSLFWIYGVARNASALCPQSGIKPGWAVGWFFVPLANLYMPYENMRKIWAASKGQQPDSGAAQESVLLLCWWLLCIVGGLGERLMSRFIDEDVHILAQGANSADFWLMVFFSITLVANILFFRVIRTINAMQAVQSEHFSTELS